MTDSDLLRRYNYDSFIHENFGPWMRFDQSPPLGKVGPSFPLWRLEDAAETSLIDVVKENRYTVVEFGSFT